MCVCRQWVGAISCTVVPFGGFGRLTTLKYTLTEQPLHMLNEALEKQLDVSLSLSLSNQGGIKNTIGNKRQAVQFQKCVLEQWP